MGRKRPPLQMRVTVSYTENPAAVDRALDAWADFLAQLLRKKLVEDAERERSTVLCQTPNAASPRSSLPSSGPGRLPTK